MEIGYGQNRSLHAIEFNQLMCRS